MAGVIVGIIAIPLAIAFGIASGVGPFEGLVTAIIGGFLISAFGGSDVQIGGPTGAFIIIIYGVIQQFGMAGLVVATVMAGIMLVLMGVYKLGGIIKFVPYPVIIGFTGGIALTIFSTQMNDFFGLGIKEVPAGFIEKWGCYIKNFGNLDIWSTMIGVVSLLIIFLMPKVSKKIPGSLAAILIMTPVSMLLVKYAGVDSVSTIGDLYTLPTGFPMPDLSRFAIPEGGIMPMIRT
ncbi:MAG: sodium-independent anion transporter, partial [Rikenellaceae bacterium]|nr:sodium-independent anion transporter [Rikenellaceae bacterium]